MGRDEGMDRGERDRPGRLRVAGTGLGLLVLVLAAGFAARVDLGRTGGLTVEAERAPADDGDGRTGPWRRLPDAPTGRLRGHTAVWSGSELLVWGGRGRRGEQGAAYHPVDGWRTLPPAPLDTRVAHAAAWTGRELAVWGGQALDVDRARAYRDDGALYDPATDRWRPLAPAPLSPRASAEAVWTGEELLVWGGYLLPVPGRAEFLADGAAYDPATGRWRRLAEAPRQHHLGQTALWTGEELVLWGGADPHTGRQGAAVAYDPSADRWRELPPAPLRDGRVHVAAWTGSRLLVWTGAPGRAAEGAAYDPVRDSWQPLADAPFQRRAGASVMWADDRLLVWGGAWGGRHFTSGAVYEPSRDRWLALPDPPPGLSTRGSAVWTGRELLVWGGAGAGAGQGAPGVEGAALRLSD